MIRESSGLLIQEDSTPGRKREELDHLRKRSKGLLRFLETSPE
jgi:hypothetical protein